MVTSAPRVPGSASSGIRKVTGTRVVPLPRAVATLKGTMSPLPTRTDPETAFTGEYVPLSTTTLASTTAPGTRCGRASRDTDTGQ